MDEKDSANSMLIELSVVIPAYNEEKRLTHSLPNLIEYLDNLGINYELIIVDDGSTDGTVKMASKFADGNKIRIMQNKQNRGKGYSVRKGILHSRGKFILFSDADLSTPIEELEKFLAFLKSEYDIAIASRNLPASHIEVQQPLHRRVMGKAFSFLARLFAVKGITNTQCGFKCFRRDVAQRIFALQTLEGFGFDVEILFLAQKMGYKIKEVPVVWRDSPQSKVRTIKDPFKMFLDLLKIRLRHRKM